MNEKEQRINRAYNHLRINNIIKNQAEIARRMGTSAGNVSKALNGSEIYLTDGFMERFNNAFDNIFSMEWLLTGVGNMLVADEPTESNSEPELHDNAFMEHLMSLNNVLAEQNKALLEQNKSLLEQNKTLMGRVKLRTDQLVELVSSMNETMTERFDKQDEDARRDLQTALEQCSTVNISAIIEQLNRATNNN